MKFYQIKDGLVGLLAVALLLAGLCALLVFGIPAWLIQKFKSKLKRGK